MRRASHARYETVTFVSPFFSWRKHHVTEKSCIGLDVGCLRYAKSENPSDSYRPRLVLQQLAYHRHNNSKRGAPKRQRVSSEGNPSNKERKPFGKPQRSQRSPIHQADDIDVGLSTSERLHKVLSRVGLASRREAEKLIMDGRISVNGKRRTELGTNVNVWKDKIFVNGIAVRIPSSAVWLAVHKPRGFLSTTIGSRSLERFLDPRLKGLIPAGAIEEEASGLVILTNERGAVPPLVCPDSPHAQKWLVCCRDMVTEDQLKTLNSGVVLGGDENHPVQASVSLVDYGRWDISPKERTLMCLLEIRLRDCRHHVIRRICEAVGLSVVRMNRRSIGPILLDGIQLGKYRELRAKEIKALKRGVSERTLSKSKY